ncbi:MAG: Prokaryotic dksA/traR C4-type zinc finger [Patescibacteria group bacterium]|nr:Prokaryotic dksA/traR C4-type zinc finger [Patescibacteria group bacterium]
MLDLEAIKAEIMAKLHRYTVEWPGQPEPPAHLALKQGEPVRYLRRALDKLSAGTYGLCDNCGEVIDAERLRVVIAACRCRACQIEHDTNT